MLIRSVPAFHHKVRNLNSNEKPRHSHNGLFLIYFFRILVVVSDFELRISDFSSYLYFNIFPIIQNWTLNVECSPVLSSNSKFNVKCSMFEVPLFSSNSKLNVECSMFDVPLFSLQIRCSMFNVRSSMFACSLFKFEVEC